MEPGCGVRREANGDGTKELLLLLLIAFVAVMVLLVLGEVESLKGLW